MTVSRTHLRSKWPSASGSFGSCSTTSICRCYYGRDLVFHFVNHQYAEFLGLPEERILGRRLPDIIGEPVFAQVRPFLERALGGAQVTYERDRPWPGRGQRRVRITLFPDVGADGDVHGLYAVGYDIDEDHRLRSELREGVETAEQLAFLTERGCDFYQGHYFSRPLESAAFIDLALRHQDAQGSPRRLERLEPAPSA